jgi:hypothetical protein
MWEMRNNNKPEKEGGETGYVKCVVQRHYLMGSYAFGIGYISKQMEK